MHTTAAHKTAEACRDATPRPWRLAVRLAALRGLVVLAVAPGQPLVAELTRLPPVRLPLVRPAPFAAAARAEADSIVQVAGGAVELRVGSDWWIWEVPAGREVRVALAPSRPASIKKLPTAGYWVCFHWKPATTEDSRRYLSDQLEQRLRVVTDGKARPDRETQFQRLGPWDAAEVEFVVPPPEAASTAVMRGSHVLVQTEWGLFEFHAKFPADEYQERLGEMTRLLQQVKLARPGDQKSGPPLPQTRDAETIYGAWKAFRSRVRLSADGTIEIVTDQPQLISPPVQLEEVQPTTRQLLQGRYRADGDLLFVEWNDGSQLNFRWKLSGRDLLLTDHAGQISQLRRLAE